MISDAELRDILSRFRDILGAEGNGQLTIHYHKGSPRVVKAELGAAELMGVRRAKVVR